MAIYFFPNEALDFEFAVGSEERNGTTHVWLYGELDLAGVPLFEHELEHIHDQGRDVEFIDLAGLTFIDAAGVHALVDACEGVSTHGSAPALIGALPRVTRVLELLGLAHLLAQRW